MDVVHGGSLCICKVPTSFIFSVMEIVQNHRSELMDVASKLLENMTSKSVKKSESYIKELGIVMKQHIVENVVLSEVFRNHLCTRCGI